MTSSVFELELRAIDMRSVDGLFDRKSNKVEALDPFFEVMNDEETVIARSHIVMDNLNPSWPTLSIDMKKLCDNDPTRQIFLTFYDYESDGNHQFMGHVKTTVIELVVQAQELSSLKKKSKRALRKRDPSFRLIIDDGIYGNVYVCQAEMTTGTPDVLEEIEGSQPASYHQDEVEGTESFDDTDDQPNLTDEETETEAEAVAQAEAEAIRQAEEEVERMIAEEEKAKLDADEAEAIRQAEEEVRRIMDEEAEAKRVADEEEAIRQAEEEVKRLLEEEAEMKRLEVEEQELEQDASGIDRDEQEEDIHGQFDHEEEHDAESQRLAEVDAELLQLEEEEAELQRIEEAEAELLRLDEEAEAQRLVAAEMEAAPLSSENQDADSKRAEVDAIETEAIRLAEEEAERLLNEEAELKLLQDEKGTTERSEGEEAESLLLDEEEAESQQVEEEDAQLQRLEEEGARFDEEEAAADEKEDLNEHEQQEENGKDEKALFTRFGDNQDDKPESSETEFLPNDDADGSKSKLPETQNDEVHEGIEVELSSGSVPHEGKSELASDQGAPMQPTPSEIATPENETDSVSVLGASEQPAKEILDDTEVFEDEVTEETLLEEARMLGDSGKLESVDEADPIQEEDEDETAAENAFSATIEGTQEEQPLNEEGVEVQLQTNGDVDEEIKKEEPIGKKSDPDGNITKEIENEAQTEVQNTTTKQVQQVLASPEIIHDSPVEEPLVLPETSNDSSVEEPRSFEPIIGQDNVITPSSDSDAMDLKQVLVGEDEAKNTDIIGEETKESIEVSDEEKKHVESHEFKEEVEANMQDARVPSDEDGSRDKSRDKADAADEVAMGNETSARSIDGRGEEEQVINDPPMTGFVAGAEAKGSSKEDQNSEPEAMGDENALRVTNDDLEAKASDAFDEREFSQNGIGNADTFAAVTDIETLDEEKPVPGNVQADLDNGAEISIEHTNGGEHGNLDPIKLDDVGVNSAVEVEGVSSYEKAIEDSDMISNEPIDDAQVLTGSYHEGQSNAEEGKDDQNDEADFLLDELLDDSEPQETAEVDGPTAVTGRGLTEEEVGKDEEKQIEEELHDTKKPDDVTGEALRRLAVEAETKRIAQEEEAKRLEKEYAEIVAAEAAAARRLAEESKGASQSTLGDEKTDMDLGPDGSYRSLGDSYGSDGRPRRRHSGTGVYERLYRHDTISVSFKRLSYKEHEQRGATSAPSSPVGGGKSVSSGSKELFDRLYRHDTISLSLKRINPKYYQSVDDEMDDENDL